MTRHERTGGAIFVAVVAAIAIAMTAGGGGAETSNPPATVTATPTSGVTNGTTISIQATANSGSHVYGIEARICTPSAAIDWSADFNPTQTGKCVLHPLSTGTDTFAKAASTGDRTSVAMTFKAGTGSDSYQTQDGTNVSITCGPANPCKLVVKLQVPNAVNFASFPLDYTPIATTTTSTSTTSTSTTSTTILSTTTTTAAPTTTTTAAPTTTTTAAPTTTTTAAAPTTTTTAAPTTTTTHATTTTTHPATTTTAPASTTTTPGSTTSTTSLGEPTASLSTSSGQPGTPLSVDGSGYGPGTSVDIYLHSDPILLKTVVADDSGNVHAAVTIPLGTPVGAHTIELNGVDPDGAPRVESASFTVAAATTATTLPLVSDSSTTSSGGGSSVSTLSATGRRFGPWVSLGFGLILLGVAVRREGRPRRATQK